jgi:hypothetical protein
MRRKPRDARGGGSRNNKKFTVPVRSEVFRFKPHVIQFLIEKWFLVACSATELMFMRSNIQNRRSRPTFHELNSLAETGSNSELLCNVCKVSSTTCEGRAVCSIVNCVRNVSSSALSFNTFQSILTALVGSNRLSDLTELEKFMSSVKTHS